LIAVVEAVAVDTPRPTPPFWGTKILTAAETPSRRFSGILDLQALFVGQWQFRKPKSQSKQEYDQFLQEKVHPILAGMEEKIVKENLLNPTLIYGYFPCQSVR
jgi:5-methyltetrahydrofolate--homocysteine methyltransferase